MEDTPQPTPLVMQDIPLVPATPQGLVIPLVQGVQVTLQHPEVIPQHLEVTLPQEEDQVTLEDRHPLE